MPRLFSHTECAEVAQCLKGNFINNSTLDLNRAGWDSLGK